ncbi:MAG TPA: TIGR01777 family oxidoreductase [Flavisolibacter sp.]|nr:TIGR01777 family oxidoreductase [Flavisolibacter sp.]
MATILITGGTGMIGTRLTQMLAEKGHKIIVLTRDRGKAGKSKGPASFAAWDIPGDGPGAAGQIDREAVEQADFIIHLAGANVAEGRWTATRKKEIVDSRVKTGELLVEAVRSIPNKIKAVISASAIGCYGPDPSVPNPRPFEEADPPAEDFLGRTVQQWEGAVSPLAEMGRRLVILRVGIVLSKEGGAYKEFKKSFPFRIAPVLGSGKQVISWIHIDDLCRLFITAMENEAWQGVYNAVAPAPVSNRQLMKAIAKELGGPFIPAPVPAFALRIALGEMSVEVLKSTTVSSARAERAGFSFSCPTIEKAIHTLEA